MPHQLNEPFIYNGDKLPVGGVSGDLLVKTAGANFYCKWRHLQDLVDDADLVLDEGEY